MIIFCCSIISLILISFQILAKNQFFRYNHSFCQLKKLTEYLCWCIVIRGELSQFIYPCGITANGKRQTNGSAFFYFFFYVYGVHSKWLGTIVQLLGFLLRFAHRGVKSVFAKHKNRSHSRLCFVFTTYRFFLWNRIFFLLYSDASFFFFFWFYSWSFVDSRIQKGLFFFPDTHQMLCNFRAK